MGGAATTALAVTDRMALRSAGATVNTRVAADAAATGTTGTIVVTDDTRLGVGIATMASSARLTVNVSSIRKAIPPGAVVAIVLAGGVNSAATEAAAETFCGATGAVASEPGKLVGGAGAIANFSLTTVGAAA